MAWSSAAAMLISARQVVMPWKISAVMQSSNVNPDRDWQAAFHNHLHSITAVSIVPHLTTVMRRHAQSATPTNQQADKRAAPLRTTPNDWAVLACNCERYAHIATNWYRRMMILNQTSQSLIHDCSTVEGRPGIFSWIGRTTSVGISAAYRLSENKFPKCKKSPLWGYACFCKKAPKEYLNDNTRLLEINSGKTAKNWNSHVH